MTLFLIALAALSWTGLSLAVLAMVLRRIGTARQAAWRAFGIGRLLPPETRLRPECLPPTAR